MIGWVRRMMGSSKARIARAKGPSPEELELNEAHREAKETREAARRIIEAQQAEMHWLERALVPTFPDIYRAYDERGSPE